MKRSVLFTTTLVFILTSFSLSAQNYFAFEVSSTNVHVSKYAKKDIREFHNFRKNVLKFEDAIYYRDVHKANKLKRKILKQMKDEIRDSKKKLRFIEKNSFNNKGLHQKYDRRNEYSKRNRSSKSERKLRAQIDEQVSIYHKLDRMNLNRNKRFFKQAEKHHYLMLLFQQTLKEDLSISFNDFRNDRRYRN